MRQRLRVNGNTGLVHRTGLYNQVGRQPRIVHVSAAFKPALHRRNRLPGLPSDAMTVASVQVGTGV